jgi:hypothetical protein
VLGLVEGVPLLQLHDREGRVRVTIGVNADGPGIALLNGQGKTLAMLASADGGQALHLYDEDSEMRVALTTIGSDCGLMLRDSDGDLVALLGHTDRPYR